MTKLKVYLRSKNFLNELKRLNISQSQFAGSIGISNVYMSDVIGWHRPVSDRLIKKMSSKLPRLPFDDLFYVRLDEE